MSADEGGRRKRSEAEQRREQEEGERQRRPRVLQVMEAQEGRCPLQAARRAGTQTALWAQSCYEAKTRLMMAETLQAYAARKRSGCSCSSLTLYWRRK